MKDLPKIFIIASLIIIMGLLFFYLYFFKMDLMRVKFTLKKELKKNDIVIFFPDWEKNDILSLDGLPLITTQENQYINLFSFKRAFIVKNTHHYKNENLPILNEMLLNKRFVVGNYRVEEYKLPDFNLSENINRLRVFLFDSENKKECPHQDNLYKCQEMGWQYVGLSVVDVNGQKAECIWAHPIGGKKIIIESEIIPALSGNFVFYQALASTSGFDFNKPEVKTDIFINDRAVHSATIARSKEWQKSRFTFKDGRAKILRVEIFSNAEYKNHFCFNIEGF
ncbi:MAG: hypothetical protein ACP5QK_09485 [Myxococcota bacterium]